MAVSTAVEVGLKDPRKLKETSCIYHGYMTAKDTGFWIRVYSNDVGYDPGKFR
jgi:hypothetical protein